MGMCRSIIRISLKSRKHPRFRIDYDATGSHTACSFTRTTVTMLIRVCRSTRIHAPDRHIVAIFTPTYPRIMVSMPFDFSIRVQMWLPTMSLSLVLLKVDGRFLGKRPDTMVGGIMVLIKVVSFVISSGCLHVLATMIGGANVTPLLVLMSDMMDWMLLVGCAVMRAVIVGMMQAIFQLVQRMFGSVSKEMLVVSIVTVLASVIMVYNVDAVLLFMVLWNRLASVSIVLVSMMMMMMDKVEMMSLLVILVSGLANITIVMLLRGVMVVGVIVVAFFVTWMSILVPSMMLLLGIVIAWVIVVDKMRMMPFLLMKVSNLAGQMMPLMDFVLMRAVMVDRVDGNFLLVILAKFLASKKMLSSSSMLLDVSAIMMGKANSNLTTLMYDLMHLMHYVVLRAIVVVVVNAALRFVMWLSNLAARVLLLARFMCDMVMSIDTRVLCRFGIMMMLFVRVVETLEETNCFFGGAVGHGDGTLCLSLSCRLLFA